MEILYPTNINSHIRTNAVEVNKGLDSTWVSVSDAESYKRHLNDRIEYPTLGRLARHSFVDSVPKIQDSGVVWRNEQIILNQDNEAAQLLKTVKRTISKLYPKTQKVREYIIKNNRLVFDGVKKTKHYNSFDRLRIFFTKVR